MQWWATILENVSIKATPTHSLLKKDRIKRYNFLTQNLFSLWSDKKKPKNFLRTDKAIKQSLIQWILRWNDSNFDIKIFFYNEATQISIKNFFLRWSDTNFDQKFFLHDEATHSFKIQAIKRHFFLRPSMKRHRETVVLRAAYWHGILPSLLGEKGLRSQDGCPLPTWPQLA